MRKFYIYALTLATIMVAAPAFAAPSAALLPFQTNMTEKDELRAYLILKKKMAATGLFNLARRGDVTKKMKELEIPEGQWYVSSIIVRLARELNVRYILVGSLKNREAQMLKAKATSYRVVVYDGKSGKKLADCSGTASIIKNLVNKEIGSEQTYRLNEAANKLIRELQKHDRQGRF